MVSVQKVSVLADGKPMPIIKSSMLGTENESLRKDRSLMDKIAIITTNCSPKDAHYQEEETGVRNSSQSYFHGTIHARSCHGDSAVYPQSPCSGMSDECKAMANACSHDHDYSEQPPNALYSPRSLNKYKGEINPTSRIIVQRVDAIPNAAIGTPRASSQIRPRRMMLVRKATLDLSNAPTLETCNGHFVKPVPPEKKISDGFSKESAIWNSGVACPRKLTGRESFFENSLSDATKPSGDEIGLHIVPPRPSITPFPPPSGRRIHTKSKFATAKEQTHFQSDESNNIDDLSKLSTCTNSVDSAYNSLNCSMTNSPQTPPGGRPPSGGKRSATCGLTLSSSSGASSDEGSDTEIPCCSLMDELIDGRETQSDDFKASENFLPYKPCVLSSSSRPRRKILSAKKHKKVSTNVDKIKSNTDGDKGQFIPTPPTRKAKKGKPRSIPMRLRALPTSFWEEPNRANQSPYTILPPVYPFLHQDGNEVITDILPEATSQEKDFSSSAPLTSSDECDRPRHGTVIRTGDTDLLLRLFDKVETTPDRTVSRPKRGRPKKPSYNLGPACRRGRDENPCIIDSITEKLFPKLTLDNRYAITSLALSSGIAVSGVPSNAELQSEAKQPKSLNPTIDDSQSEPQSPLSFSLDLRDSVGESTSPLLAQQRQPSLLPQLVTPKDYSQLLNELASVL